MQPGLTATPLPLMAMQGTSTVRLDLDGLRADDADVTLVADAAQWLEADRCRTANVGPHTFGLLRETTTRLRERAPELAAQLAEQAEQLRTEAYRLLDDVDPCEQVEQRLDLRARALLLAVQATTALVTVTGGSGMALSAAPQRLAREALFHLVQAQTPPVKQATLHRLGG